MQERLQHRAGGLFFIAFLLALPLRPSNIATASPSPPGDLPEVNFEGILQHVGFFSGLPSRVAGYDGFYEAADYIKGYWLSLGLDVREEPFNITAPVVERSSITILMPNGSRVTVGAYPLWPNHVNPSPYTSPEGGDRLVYVERGLPEDFDGVDPKGSFVLMDFNNRWYWKNAAVFGAKGVVFVEPLDTTGTQSVQKMFNVPINFPRLYARGAAASLLKELASKPGGARVWVDSSTVWEEREVANLVVEIEGTDPALREEVAIIGAYYDSWSAVPQLSPGATDSMGVSFLMELSRLMRDNPPRRTVWLVAFAAHYQALAGAREFVENHFDELGSKLKMMLSLDLASDSDFLATYATGSMYGYSRPQDFLPHYNTWLRRMFGEWLPQVEEELGEAFHLIDGVQWVNPSWISASPPFESFLKYFEAEVFTEACYCGGMGFVTTNSFRLYQGTPFDTFDRITADNLRRQAAVLWPILYESSNMDVDYPLYPKRAGALDHGLVTVTLSLAQYNRTTDWFDDFAHEDAIFFISVGPTMNPVGSIVYAGFSPSSAVGPSKSVAVQGVSVGLFAAPPIAGSGGIVAARALSTPLGFTMVVKPDANGKVVLKGIKPLTGIDAQAFVLDPETGSISYATDTGPFGTGKLRLGGLFGQASSAAAPTLTPGMGGVGYLMESGQVARSFSVYVTHGTRYVPVFETSSISLLGLFDPLRIEDPRSLYVVVLNFISHSYMVWRDTLAVWPEAMVFLQPDVPSEILVMNRDKIIAVLNNATDENPLGMGYKLGRGESMTLTVLDAIRSIYVLADTRGGFLMAKMSANPKMALHIDRMYELKRLADNALLNDDDGMLYSYSLAYWQNGLSVYQSSFELIFDVVRTATFFFFLSAAFVILLAKLISGSKTGLRRMAVIVPLFLATNFALSLVHPGYSISSNIWMLIDGLSVVLFSLLLLYVVMDEFNTAMKSISVSILGAHRSDIERGSLMVTSLSIGVENLRKRPVRTALALSTIVITISAMTLFTTMGVMVQSYRTQLGPSPYTGLLIKRPLPDAMRNTISEQYLLAIGDIASEGTMKFEVNPRSWIYPPGQSMLLTWNQKYSAIRGILAMTVNESRILEDAIVQGTTFQPGITNTALISEALAEGLSKDLGTEIGPGSKLSLYGIPVMVIGVLDDETATALLSRDLDQGAIVPPDPVATSLSGIPTALDLSALMIVPYNFATNYFNVQPNAIALYSKSAVVNEDDLWKRSFDLVSTLPFDMYYGVKEEDVARRSTTRDIFSLSGAENMIIPLALSSLTILSMMLSSVYERTKEITTLSTIGISPKQIGTMFVMESIALAFLGSFLGYVLGAGATSILWNAGMFPEGLIPNVSSGVVIIVIGVMMVTTMLSSVYPMIKASRLATPSLVRKWRVGTKPLENTWVVGLPFNATPDEGLGVLNFMGEYLEASATERTGLFMLLKPINLDFEDSTRILKTRLQLSPFDAGIIQDFQIYSRQMAADRYGFEIRVTRIMGLEALWITSNKALLDEIRKQFLFWRGLSSDEKQRYIEKVRRK